ncbi:MAG TPA: alpha/beta hydrolase [Candidatus Dormibacteraeota bacterium]|nr:alpha/beta hydrolase [Candidatus Dormibacteraeota bacterium]
MSEQQLQRIVGMIRSKPVKTDQTIEEERQDYEGLALLPSPSDIKTQPVTADGVPAEWVYAPSADVGRAVLYLHGGGYVLGSIDTHRALAGRISRAAQARVLLVDYRLAPEHPFPAALDDSLAAYRWMLADGANPARVVLGGDSAGGGLAVATLVAIKDARLPMPAAAVCISPWVDLECVGDSMTTRTTVDPWIDREYLTRKAALYLAGKHPHTPLAAPVYADLRGLPPLLIQVGTAEILLDDSKRLAERARRAGVDVVLETWEGMIHGWHAFAEALDEGQLAIDRLGEFIRANAA